MGSSFSKTRIWLHGASKLGRAWTARHDARGLVLSFFFWSLVVAASVAAPSAVAALSAPKLEINSIAEASGDASLGSPEDHASPEQVAADLNDFISAYRDYANLYSAQDFRTPFAKKIIDRINFDKPETHLKLAAFKKKLDQLQRQMRSYLLLNSVRVTEKQKPKVYKLAKLAAERLEMRGNFNVFILNSPTFNAFTYSYNNNDFDVVIHSGAADKLSDDALLALLGHEMGHVKDQAILLKLVLASDFEARNKTVPGMISAGFYNELFDELPAGMAAFPNLRNMMAKMAASLSAEGAAFEAFNNAAEAAEFGRNCEINADRAAVIVTGSEAPALKLLAALAHGSSTLTDDFDVEELVKQISEVLASNEDPADFEALLAEQESHPFPVVRLIHARAFASSKSLKALLATLEQDPFAKELDLLTRNIVRFSDLQARYKKYLSENADTDDMLIRLKTEKQFTSQSEKVGGAANTLAQLVLLQLVGSDLTQKDNARFNAFVSKAKADSTTALSQLMVPAVIGVLEELSKQASGAALEELKAKIKVLEVLKSLGSLGLEAK